MTTLTTGPRNLPALVRRSSPERPLRRVIGFNGVRRLFVKGRPGFNGVRLAQPVPAAPRGDPPRGETVLRRRPWFNGVPRLVAADGAAERPRADEMPDGGRA